MFEALYGYTGVFGSLYVVLWSVSYYPTIFKHKREISEIKDITKAYKPLKAYQEIDEGKSTKGGISINYLLMNLFGYLIYLCAICLQLYDPHTQASTTTSGHGENHPTTPGSLIDMYDLVFYIHGLVMNLVFLYQVVALSRARALYAKSLQGGAVTSGLRVHGAVRALLCVMSLLVTYNWFTRYNSNGSFDYLGFIRLLSLIKMSTSLVKVIPQLVLNYQTKSMGGLAINGVWLDLAGNLLFFLQLFVNCEIILAARHDRGSTIMTIMAENPGKVGILLVGFGFNVVSVIQYYMWKAPTKAALVGKHV